MLWAVGAERYLVIECKSGVLPGSLIDREELGQLSHSVDWFRESYDAACEATPVLVHPSHEHRTNASPREGTRVLDFGKLAELRSAVRAFGEAVAGEDRFRQPRAVATRLSAHGLNAGGIVSRWTREPRRARR